MTFDIVNPMVNDYLTGLVPVRHPELQAMEAYAREQDFPIIGPVVGHLCYLVARMLGARRVFELGSGYGYSTAWFARAIQEAGSGEVFHTVWDSGLSTRARHHLGKLGYQDIIRYRVGESIQLLRETPGPFDLIFNDIDKQGYPESLPIITEKLRPGGVLIVDNLILGGRIFDETDVSEPVEGVRELTQRIVSDQRWITSVIPVRDGILVAYKR